MESVRQLSVHQRIQVQGLQQPLLLNKMRGQDSLQSPRSPISFFLGSEVRKMPLDYTNRVHVCKCDRKTKMGLKPSGSLNPSQRGGLNSCQPALDSSNLSTCKPCSVPSSPMLFAYATSSCSRMQDCAHATTKLFAIPACHCN
jgi:hypothetical protein